MKKLFFLPLLVVLFNFNSLFAQTITVKDTTGKKVTIRTIPPKPAEKLAKELASDSTALKLAIILEKTNLEVKKLQEEVKAGKKEMAELKEKTTDVETRISAEESFTSELNKQVDANEIAVKESVSDLTKRLLKGDTLAQQIQTNFAKNKTRSWLAITLSIIAGIVGTVFGLMAYYKRRA